MCASMRTVVMFPDVCEVCSPALCSLSYCHHSHQLTRIRVHYALSPSLCSLVVMPGPSQTRYCQAGTRRYG